MASSSQIAYSYDDRLEKAEAQVKTWPGLWIDLMDDLRVWKKVTDWLEVSFFFVSEYNCELIWCFFIAPVGQPGEFRNECKLSFRVSETFG